MQVLQASNPVTTRNSRWFYVLWAMLVIQVFAIQEITLHALNSQKSSSLLVDRAIRLTLDILFCGFGLSAIPWALLPLTFLGVAIFQFSILAYYDYFMKPLSARVIASSSEEGFNVADAAFEILGSTSILLITLVIVNILILFLARPRLRIKFASISLAVYLLVIGVTNFVHKPFRKLRTFDSVAGIGLVYGYWPAWIAEMLLYNEEDILNDALKRAKKESNILTPLAPPLTIPDKLVFIQLESFDYALIDFRINGQEVTPNLNRLRRISQAYSVKAEKVIGSCDSDFTTLMGRLPSDQVTTYKLEDYPFDQSIIGELKRRGYQTSFYHGVSGEFFNRRSAFQKMGFDQMYFREELVQDGLVANDWAVDDKPLFDFAAGHFGQAKKEFQFIITVTSHIPFHHIPDEAQQFFPGSNKSQENYFNATNYTDWAVGRYIEQLPTGTLVVLYGDHMSKIQNSDIGYTPPLNWRVPFFIYRVGETNGAARAHHPAPKRDITLLDGANYLHHWVDAVPLPKKKKHSYAARD